jgi:hypothetical protein
VARIERNDEEMASDHDDIIVVDEHISAPALPVNRVAGPAGAAVICIEEEDEEDIEVVPDAGFQAERPDANYCSMDCCGAVVCAERVKSAVAKAVRGALLLCCIQYVDT